MPQALLCSGLQGKDEGSNEVFGYVPGNTWQARPFASLFILGKFTIYLPIIPSLYTVCLPIFLLSPETIKTKPKHMIGDSNGNNSNM